MEMINNLVGKVTGWIDNLFGYFGFYTENYSKYLVYILGVFVAAKIFKIKVDVKTGGK